MSACTYRLPPGAEVYTLVGTFTADEPAALHSPVEVAIVPSALLPPPSC